MHSKCKAQYNKVEFNTVDFVESQLSLKPATNRQQSRLSPIQLTLLPMWTTLLRIRSTLLLFAVDTVNFVES